MAESNTFPHQIRIRFLGIPNKRKIKRIVHNEHHRRQTNLLRSRLLILTMTISNIYGLPHLNRSNPIRKVHPNRLQTTLSSRKLSPCNQNTRRSKPTKKNDKEFVEPWTIEEEIALCKAFVAKSKDIVKGNGKKAAGFWREVAEHFHEEMGKEKRSYDSINCKWKNRIRPKVSQFCEIYNSVRDRHQSGSRDNIVYQEAELEYRTIYNAPFTLTECWKILKDHPKWKKVEMTKFYKSKKSSSKKSRTLENTPQGNLDSVHISVNLNDEAADSEDVEAQEMKESSSEYLRIKERELELEERKRREQGELERLRIAQREKELDLQQKMFEFQQQQKFEEDIKYYNEGHDHLTGRALSTTLFLKKNQRA
nr:hypothetical protein [Tanacetum cinerariifolium]